MTIPVTSSVVANHALAYGFVVNDGSNHASVPIQVDINGVLQVSAASSGGNVGAVIEMNSDAESAAQFGAIVAAFGFGLDSSGAWDRIRTAAANADALAPTALGNQLVIAQMFGWDGAAFDRVRVANIFHTGVATTVASTAIWTPTAGKRFRLMGYTISVSATILTATAPVSIQLQDGGTTFAEHFATVSVTTPGPDTQIGSGMGQGYLSTAANNVLGIVLSAALQTGGCSVNVWGTEE